MSKWEEKYQAGQKTNALALKKEYNALKEVEFPWVYDVTKYASQQPFIHLQRSFRVFLQKEQNIRNTKRREFMIVFTLEEIKYKSKKSM